VVAGVAGCAKGDSGVTQGPGPSTDSTIAAVERTGGLCADGPCEELFAVTSDGRWTLSRQGEVVARGELSDDQADGLRRVVDGADLSTYPPASPGSTCPDAVDGRRTTYRITNSHGTQAVSPCTNELSDDDQLVNALDSALASVGDGGH
jgi:hypothetical protein